MENWKNWKTTRNGKLQELKNHTKTWKSEKVKNYETQKPENPENPEKSKNLWKTSKNLKTSKTSKTSTSKKSTPWIFQKMRLPLCKKVPHIFCVFGAERRNCGWIFKEISNFQRKRGGFLKFSLKFERHLKIERDLFQILYWRLKKRRGFFFFFWILKCRFFWKCRLFSIFSQPKKTALKKTEKCRKKWRIQKEGPFFKAI